MTPRRISGAVLVFAAGIVAVYFLPPDVLRDIAVSAAVILILAALLILTLADFS